MKQQLPQSRLAPATPTRDCWRFSKHHAAKWTARDRIGRTLGERHHGPVALPTAIMQAASLVQADDDMRQAP